MRYVEYEASASEPNIVIDGSPNAGTVLCLTHWPGIPSPPGLADDLSAQMAFRYLDSDMSLHGDADVVTNNHFDQDGFSGVFALVHPEIALPRRELLIDIAAAGDFAKYRDRRAARISMVMSAWSFEPDPFEHALARFADLLDDQEPYRSIWEAEDADLTASEEALAAGTVMIDDEVALDLAVVRVDESVGPWSGHRFAGSQRFEGVHPMAVHNATDMSIVALLHGHRYQLTHRYETWVQFTSRPRPCRVDLVPLAEQLTAMDDVAWSADPVGRLTPSLRHDGESSLSPETFLSAARDHLRTSPPVFDPAVMRP